MSGKPCVSVIIAAHNAARYLPRALNSVLGQSERNIEIVVVDDASIDGTRDVVAAFSRSDDRLRYLATSQNIGASAARNLGIQFSTGEWIAVLDADDWLSSDRILHLLAAAESWDADVVSDGIDVFDERSGTSVGPMFGDAEVPRLLSALAFVNGNLPDPARPRAGFGFLKPMFRRTFLADAGISYASEMKFAEDYRLYLELLLSGARWVTIPQNYYKYTVRSDSVTAKHSSKDLDLLRRFERALVESENWTHGRELRAALRAHCRTLDERYYDALFAESVARRHLREALAAFTLSPLAFRCCARRAIRGIARRILPPRQRVEAA